MKIRIKINTQFILLVLMAVSFLDAATASAIAQPAVAADKQPRAELAIAYDFVHSNVRDNSTPVSSETFNLNGGSATIAWPVGFGASGRHFAIVGDVGFTHAGSIANSNTGSNNDLTLITYTAGIRYRPSFRHSPLQPFAQILAGGAHTSGSLVDDPNTNTSNAGAAFTGNVGGGLDLRTSRHLSVRLIEADYLVTTFNNGNNNHQNNLRLAAGLVFHF